MSFKKNLKKAIQLAPKEKKDKIISSYQKVFGYPSQVMDPKNEGKMKKNPEDPVDFVVDKIVEQIISLCQEADRRELQEKMAKATPMNLD